MSDAMGHFALLIAVVGLLLFHASIGAPIFSSQHPQTILKADAGKCNVHIADSLRPNFDWSSNATAALDLARCLLHATPMPDTCVFYTRDAREDAQRFAAESGKNTIYDLYPQEYFDTEEWPASAWEASGHLRDLFRVTSRAYALACSGNVTLVLPQDQTPCPTSIWLTDEYDAICSPGSKVVQPIQRASWCTTSGWIRDTLPQPRRSKTWPGRPPPEWETQETVVCQLDTIS